MPGRRQRNKTFLAAGFLWFGHYEASENMVLIIEFSFVFLFSLGVLYNPEKLRGIRDVFLFLTFRPLPLAGHRRGSFLLLKYAHSITLRYSSPDMMIFNSSYFYIKPNVPSRTCTPLPPAMVGGRGVHFIVPHSLSAKRASAGSQFPPHLRPSFVYLLHPF